jgi:3-hydroxyisobutyrate dehydrogenase
MKENNPRASSGSPRRVGFIGLGIMGRPMAGNLLKAGFALTVHNRSRSKEAPLVEAGATPAASPAEVARDAEALITMVPDTPDLEEVLLGANGVLTATRAGSLVIDMSTVSPDRSREIAREFESQGADFLDAPVTGGDIGAQQATLTIMVGGRAEAYQRALPLFQAMGKRVAHVGPSGAGQALKLANQVLCAVNMIGLCEALSLASRSGLDLRQFLEVLSTGAGGSWALSNLGPKIVAGDLKPAFMVRLMQKDLRLAQELGRGRGVPLAGTALAQQLFRGLEAHGEGELGTQAMIRAFERWGNFKLTSSE